MNQLVYLTAIVFKPNSKGITHKLHNRFREQFNLITSEILRDRNPTSTRELPVSLAAEAGMGGKFLSVLVGPAPTLVGADMVLQPCPMTQFQEMPLSFVNNDSKWSISY